MFKKMLALLVVLAAAVPLLLKIVGAPIPGQLYTVDELLSIVQLEPQRIVGGIVVVIAWSMWLLLVGYAITTIVELVAQTSRQLRELEDATAD